MVTSTSSSLALLACYLPLTASSPATAFIHLCWAVRHLQLFMVQKWRSWVSLAQPPTLASTSLVWSDLPNCVHFRYCSPTASSSAAAPRLHPFSCCSPTTSTSAAAPRLHPLQLLLPDCILFSCCSLTASFQLLLPNYIHFSCCSQTASSSAAAPRLHSLLLLLLKCVCLLSGTLSTKYNKPTQTLQIYHYACYCFGGCTFE